MIRGRPGILAPYLLVSLLTVAPEAWAYLDPSTGSMILSAIVGLFATAALAVKTYWYKLKSLFRRRSGPEKKSSEDKPVRDPGTAAD